MEIKRLRHFLAVVNSGSFSVAAIACNLSQQGLSKSIATLEQNIGVKLLNRDTRYVTPTEYGKLLLPTARNILADTLQFQRQLDSLTGINSGRVIVGTGYSSATYILPPVVRHMTSKYPELHLVVVDGTFEELLPMVLAGELDFAICILDAPSKDTRLVQQPIMKERISIIGSHNNPLLGRDKVPLKEIVRFPWLTWGTPLLHPKVTEMVHRAGLELPVSKIVTTSMLFGLKLIQEGDYIAGFAERAVAPEIKLGTLGVVNVDVEDNELECMNYLCYRKESNLSREASFFISELKKFIDDPDCYR